MNALKKRAVLRRNRGFTLIELVLVLAIAGLIIIIVLLAVSGAQKSRRDYQRKSYLTRVTASLESFYSDNHHYPNVTSPSDIATFEQYYLPKEADPKTGLLYSQANGNFSYRGVGAPHSDIPPAGTIYIQYGHWCNRYGNGDLPTDPIAGTDTRLNAYVVWIGLESAPFYCADNYTP